MREEMFGDNLEVEVTEDILPEWGYVSVYSDTSGSVWLTPQEAEIFADRLREAAQRVREAVES